MINELAPLELIRKIVSGEIEVGKAKQATKADNATNATNATNAENADNATNATTATSANSAKEAQQVAWENVTGKPEIVKKLDMLPEGILLIMWYYSSDLDTPAFIFGGTWELLPANRVLLTYATKRSDADNGAITSREVKKEASVSNGVGGYNVYVWRRVK